MGAYDIFDPVALMRRMSEAMQLAPQTLVQPILPGWNLTLNAFNSSAPQTELEVLRQHSYGRQLGRINAALAELVRRADPAGTEACFDEFRTMLADIQRIKDGAFDQRVDKLLDDLDTLRSKDPQAHAALVGRLRGRLAEA